MKHSCRSAYESDGPIPRKLQARLYRTPSSFRWYRHSTVERSLGRITFGQVKHLRHGRIDVLVANAGMGEITPFGSIAEAYSRHDRRYFQGKKTTHLSGFFLNFPEERHA